jgi:hypothetical protein
MQDHKKYIDFEQYQTQATNTSDRQRFPSPIHLIYGAVMREFLDLLDP